MCRALTLQRRGWHLAAAEALEPTTIDVILETAEGRRGPPLRRSRHALTFRVQQRENDPRAEIFVKLFAPPGTGARIKWWIRGGRSAHVVRITTALHLGGLAAPEILMRAVHRRTRRELLATARAEGAGPIVALRSLHGSLTMKRTMLRALGAEVARLHRAGFIHGDLTPFNIRFGYGESPRFAFIDHERTRRMPRLGAGSRRLRNLVQLGRFALPGITRTDKMRVLEAYEAGLYGKRSRLLRRRAVMMLARRARRDGLASAQPALTSRHEGQAR